MIFTELKRADISMREELVSLMNSSFKSTNKYTNFFFDNMVDINNCFVCIEDNKVVSSLYNIPCGALYKGKILPCSYVYAAATLKEYRKRGFMSNLIKYANEEVAKEGKYFSVLCPQNDSLRNFYTAFGYLNFLKYLEVKIGNSIMSTYLRYSSKVSDKLSYGDIERIRNKLYNVDGSIVWNKKSIEYALKSNEMLGGSSVFCKDGCALCYVSSKHELQVIDFTAEEKNAFELLGNIYSMFRECKGYNIRIPLGYNLIGSKGSIVDFGMIKPLNKESEKIFTILQNERTGIPYMSLALD